MYPLRTIFRIFVVELKVKLINYCSVLVSHTF